MYIAAQSIGCEDMVDVRPTRLLSGMHVFSISAEVGMRTTKTGRRAPPFTALLPGPPNELPRC